MNTLIANILNNIANQYPIGANPKPSRAKPAKIVENNGAKPNCAIESPIPAKGPIRAILILRTESIL